MTLADLASLEILTFPVWIFDIERRAMWWANSEAVRLWNSESLEDLLARDWRSDMSDATKARLDNNLARFKDGETVTEQWTFYPKGEGPVTVSSTSSGTRIDDGRMAMLIEARQLEETETSPEDLRGIEALRHTSVMISLCNLDGRVLYQNPAAISAFGAAQASDGDLWSHFDDSAMAEAVKLDISTTGYHTGEYRFETSDGIVWHGIDCTRTTDPVTGEMAILVNQKDVQRARWSETVLSWSANVLEQIAANKPLDAVLSAIVEMTEATVPGMICSVHLLNEDGRRFRHGASPSLPEFYNKVIDGVEIGPDVGSCGTAAHTGELTIVEDIRSHPDWTQFRDAAEKAGLRSCWSMPVKAASGRVLGTFATYHRQPTSPAESHLSLIETAANLIALAIERHDEERQLIEARRLAEEASQAKSEFWSSMSHELRTPLNSILGFSQLLGRLPSDPLSDRHQRHVQQILDNGKHLLDLIDQVLDLSRIESRETPMLIEDVSVRAMIENCVAISMPLVQAANIDLSVEDFEPKDLACRADETQLRQVLLNLLSNAIKYNAALGKVCVGAAARDDGVVQITISDTGHGISEENKAHLFEPFNRLGRESSNVPGTGIGLSIAKRLITGMGGEIGVDSELGKGSSFWVELPAVEAQ